MRAVKTRNNLKFLLDPSESISMITQTTFRLPKAFLHPRVADKLLHSTQVNHSAYRDQLFPGAMPPMIYYAGAKKSLIPQLACLAPDSMQGLGSGFFGTGAFELNIEGRGLLKDKLMVVTEKCPHLALIWEQIQQHRMQEIMDAFHQLVRETEDALGKRTRKGSFSVTKQEYNYLAHRFNENILADKARRSSIFPDQEPLKADPDLIRMQINLYIINTCIGGVFRKNGKGLFNVQFNAQGRKPGMEIFFPLEMAKVKTVLAKIHFIRGDFSLLLDQDFPTGSFFFFDPPYFGTYDSFTEGRFSETDFSRFVAAVRTLAQQGHKLLITQSFHPEVKSRIGSIDGFNQAMIFRRDSFGKGGFIPEYVFRNYTTQSPEEQIFMAEVRRVEDKYAELVRAMEMDQDPVFIAAELMRLNGQNSLFLEKLNAGQLDPQTSED